MTHPPIPPNSPRFRVSERGNDQFRKRKCDLIGSIAWLFKPWIVKRPHGGCQVLFPLSELDALVVKIIKTIGKDRP